ncbi:putative methyltransferase NSUN7 [Clarias gariepinus]|uniref:putative methyltransferase NSUN7 n=1 Tax=Clarias gariepinus TaxID=13013 RepID=UPI00234CE6FA|nr:putative methyltransferase NSUN7 [Clarias gariepinus]
MHKLGFPDRVYAQAADVFQASCIEETLDDGAIHYAPVPHFAMGDSGNKQNTKQVELWAYELAFNTHKFRALLEDVLTDSCFQATQHLPDDLMALAMVMLYDLQDRKFQPRKPMTREGEKPVEEVRLVEDSLVRFRTKLAASLARFRIKQDLLCIEDVLPKHVKEKHLRKHKLPICAWVNTIKSSLDEVCVALKTQGFVQVDSHTRLEGRVFCKDTHCPDVLLFPHQARELLDKTTLLTDHTLIIQEKSRSLAVSALRPLLAKNTDILMAGSFSAHTVAHVGIQASVFSNHVYVCGFPTDSAHREELQATLSRVGCKNVRLLPEQFAELSEADSRLQKVRLVLVLPRCTASALTDPVAHIIHEDGDRKLLQHLSQGVVSDAKLEPLIKKQIQDLSHALTFPKVHGVVYCTCSVFAEENELVVKRAMKNAVVRTKLRPFRIVSTGRTEASGTCEGCFLCVLKREEAESVQDILVRAAAKGLLNGLALPQTQTPAPSTPSLPSQADPSVSKQLHTDIPGCGVEPTEPSRQPSPGLSDGSADLHQSFKDMNQKKKKKTRRRRVRKPQPSSGVKAKSGTMHKRGTHSSRKKAPRVQPLKTSI